MTALPQMTLPNAPAPQTRDRAVSAALDAFDRRQRGRAPAGRGSAHPRPAPRRLVIRRHQAALAASLALLVGGPVAYIVSRETPATPALERMHTSMKEGEGRLPEAVMAPEVTVLLPEPAGPAVVPPAVAGPPLMPLPYASAEARQRMMDEWHPKAGGQTQVGDVPKAEGTAKKRRIVSSEAKPAPPSAIAPAPSTGGKFPLEVQAITKQQTQAFRFSGGTGRDFVAAPAMPTPRVSAEEARPARLEPVGRDRFEGAQENGFRVVKEQPVSTFSIDVDTASYSFARASLNRNVLPQPASVRTEEMINYFPYDYAAPTNPAEPFRSDVAVFPSPWNEGRKLVRIAVKGYAVQKQERPRANLVFLVDTSGSMDAPNRLPLVKQSLALLLDQLGEKDSVAIVTYAGSAGTALPPTPASEKAKILAVIDGLGAGGSTAGGEGIRQAYRLAESGYDKDAVNRVILATDGDFNVGITNRDELKGFIERERGKGIFLSVLGFGMGNYNDALMQTLAQNGNGAAAYIDTLGEARKVLVEEASSTLIPIAKDVKIQVEFNPATVQEYRLVGYETRLLKREDFNNDKVDAGDVGSGQSVTALYEIVPIGAPKTVAELRYGPAAASVPTAATGEKADEYGFVNIRYKLPKSETSTLVQTPIRRAGETASFEAAPQEARFATAVAGFAELLRGGKHTGKLSYDEVVRMAQGAKGEDPYGYRAEFVNLVRAAKSAASLQSQRR